MGNLVLLAKRCIRYHFGGKVVVLIKFSNFLSFALKIAIIPGHGRNEMVEGMVEMREAVNGVYPTIWCLVYRLDSCVGHANHREYLYTLCLATFNSLYLASLTFTAICTPEWVPWMPLSFTFRLGLGFLVPVDCRFVYHDFLYALTLFFSSLLFLGIRH